MNTRFVLSLVTTLGICALVFAEELPQAAPSVSATQAIATVATQQPAQATAPAIAEPTEVEMREALQQQLNSILSGQIRPAAAPTSGGGYRPYYGHPYYGYYHRNSKDSNYENWTDAAARAGAVAKVEIESFKKIRCSALPGQEGFDVEYVAVLRQSGSNPIAQGIMQTSGKPMKANMYHGDKGWILSPKE